MIYGYARVSTTKQFKDGNSIQEQIAELKKNGAEKIITESFTGTTMDRPEFSKLMEELKPGDHLIVTKLDRFARTAVEGYTMVRELLDKGVTVRMLNMGTVDNTTIGDLILKVMLAFADYERAMIVERTQTGKQVARANGKQVDGRPKKFSREQIKHAMALLEDGNSYTQVERMTGISKSTLIRARREEKARAGE